MTTEREHEHGPFIRPEPEDILSDAARLLRLRRRRIQNMKSAFLHFMSEAHVEYDPDADIHSDGTMTDHTQYHIRCKYRDLVEFAEAFGIDEEYASREPIHELIHQAALKWDWSVDQGAGPDPGKKT